MAFELASNNDNDFTDQWVLYEPILACDDLTLIAFHKLSSQDNHVTARLNKDSIALNEFFVPQK